MGRSAAIVIGTQTPGTDDLVLTVTAATVRPVQLRFDCVPSSRDLREMIEEVDFEKTEFDHILDSIQVPEVESFRPIYSENELLGKKEECAEAAAGAEPTEAPLPADADAEGKSEGAAETDSEPKP